MFIMVYNIILFIYIYFITIFGESQYMNRGPIGIICMVIVDQCIIVYLVP